MNYRSDQKITANEERALVGSAQVSYLPLALGTSHINWLAGYDLQFFLLLFIKLLKF